MFVLLDRILVEHVLLKHFQRLIVLPLVRSCVRIG